MSDRCEETDLLKDQCSHCRNDLPERTGPTIDAQYDNECGYCHATVREGSPVSHTSSHGWCHPFCTQPRISSPSVGSGFRRGSA